MSQLITPIQIVVTGGGNSDLADEITAYTTAFNDAVVTAQSDPDAVPNKIFPANPQLIFDGEIYIMIGAVNYETLTTV